MVYDDYGRLVEEIRTECGGLKVEPDSVYMSTSCAEFMQTLVLISRGVSLKPPFSYDAVSLLLRCSRLFLIGVFRHKNNQQQKLESLTFLMQLL